MTVVTVNIDDKKSEKTLIALKAVFEALDLGYDIEDDVEADVDKEVYDSEFVDKIEKSRKDYEDGKGVTITIHDIWK